MTSEKIVHFTTPEKQTEKFQFNTIEQAIDDIKNGKFVIVADDEGRENEGDLICSAEKITPEMMNFMLRFARGLTCVAVTAERAAELNLTQMVEENTDPNQTAFTISIDAGFEFGVTTGISASDRATTIQRMATSNATALDFRRPGHIFPIQAKNGGVFRRIGHTEAAIDLTRLAGLAPMGVICEILNDNGEMARRDDLAAFAEEHKISFVTITQLIQYRLQNERSVTRQVSKEIDTRFGTFTAIGYKDALDGCEHLALVKGPVEALGETVPYIRVQHEDMISDLLGKPQDEMPHEMSIAMEYIQHQESGVVVYLRHRDDSVHGLLGALRAYHKPDINAQKQYDANKADLREYGVGAQILADLGVKRFNMLSQSKKKIVALRGYGLEVNETIPLAAENFHFSLPPKIELGSSNTPTMVSETIASPIVSEVIATETIAPEAVTHTETVTAVFNSPVIETTVSEDIRQEIIQEATAEPEAIVPSTVTAEIANAMPVTDEAPIPSVAAPVVAVHVMAQNENNKSEAQNEIPVLKAEPREPRFTTMKMGGQIMSGQALFEG